MIPNLLSVSRLPLTVVLCVALSHHAWVIALGTFAVASFTDWLDGWWARHFNQKTQAGRSLDPLTDKVLIGCAFIFLQNAEVGVEPWMVAVIIGRELWVTGLRGMVEATGAAFGADWFGKLKTFLQCGALFAILGERCYPAEELKWTAVILLYGALIATIGSGIQYTAKAIPILR